MNMLEGMLVLLRVTHSTIMTLKSFQDQQEMSMIKESIKVKQMIITILKKVFRLLKFFIMRPEYLFDISILTYWFSKLID
mmetsp:Transcript_34010/g.39248  ORF Transcript_34010/g.39248 Transcript_34010/m.39248 type:complete len:80 (-) Transcript_34010:8-247(-)